MQISQNDVWLFPELRNNGAALYTLFTVGKICRQNVSFELEKVSLFPPSNRTPALFLKVFLLSNIFPSDLISAIFTFVPEISDVCNFAMFGLSGFMCVGVSVTIELCFNRLYLLSLDMVRSSMYIYGGFSGPLLNDVLAYTPPSCLAFSNPIACAAAGPGVRCHWVSSRCLSWEPKSPEQIVPAAFCVKPTGMLSMSSDSSHLCTSFQIFWLSCQHTCYLLVIILKNQASEVCWNSVITGAGGHSCNSYLI